MLPTLVIFIKQIVNEEIDKALAISNKRKKQFKKNFGNVVSEIDTLNIKRNPLNLEADATSPPPAPAPDPAVVPPATPAPNPTTPPTPPAAPTANVSAPSTPGPGTDPNNASGVLPGDPMASEDDTLVDDPAGLNPTAPGSLGFGGGGVGGGGSGGGSDLALGGASGEAEGEMGGEGEGEDEEWRGDPIDAMVSGAQELLSQTQDPNLILKSLKGQIQTVFKEPSHALGMIKALYDTNDLILQSVAQKLYLFIKSTG